MSPTFGSSLIDCKHCGNPQHSSDTGFWWLSPTSASCWHLLETCRLSRRVLLLQDEDEEVYKRDFSAPTLEDHFNKTILPKVMQVGVLARGHPA